MTDYERNCQYLALKYFDLALPVEADELYSRFCLMAARALRAGDADRVLRLQIVHDAILTSDFCETPWRRKDEVAVA